MNLLSIYIYFIQQFMKQPNKTNNSDNLQNDE